jgi:hypothetical protein
VGLDPLAMADSLAATAEKPHRETQYFAWSTLVVSLASLCVSFATVANYPSKAKKTADQVAQASSVDSLLAFAASTGELVTTAQAGRAVRADHAPRFGRRAGVRVAHNRTLRPRKLGWSQLR